MARSRQYANYRDLHACRSLDQTGSTRSCHGATAAIRPLSRKRQTYRLLDDAFFYAERKTSGIAISAGSLLGSPHNDMLRIKSVMRNTNPRLAFAVTLSSSPNRYPLYARRPKHSWLAERIKKDEV